MHRADELSLAWALADSAAAFLSADAFTLVCVKIGAGELESAIRYLLHCHAHCDAELSGELAARVRAWITGYRGSDDEYVLRRLVGRIRVSALTRQPSCPRGSEYQPVAHRLVARRRANCT